ncbi:transcriptional regulator [Vibrio cincinnatiensis]|jgi:ArsR family transcriptional regulator|uniref:Transcriptional regulator, ArsR family n=1 Tax=Vibrio cincinnatiensis DSM 19608 TaxID=1123491 RepID=A0A1T4QM19_VIBCI|nr:metalloregulator ArsR/SmtB family transcription factor [Vibrio cincinnatiensis]SKA04511.1 transcriptional regulator, ArsR family [Vibrio cincinnatiensis DSM 19608]SUP49569.1 transcriptional regulator [Vibrio cincinnatiensis]
MPLHAPKDTLYTTLAEVAQSIAHSHRLELLEYLAQGQHSVEELAALSGLTFANTSRHLQILRRARLVETERRGKNILYSIVNQNEVVALLKALGCVGERNRAEIKQIMNDYFDEKDSLTPVSRETLLSQLQEGTVTLIDVRPEHEFNQGHLPGALNITLDELEAHLALIPKNQQIVAYCRGPYCVLSFEVVEYLRAKGYRVRRLEDGYPEWKAAGLEVESVNSTL